MTRQELLTKLATECATWDKVERFADFIDHCSTVVPPVYITTEEWLAERERLLNKPSWNDAPRWAAYLALDEGGAWFWYGHMVEKGHVSWEPFDCSLCDLASEAVIIPAGYDWRDSLEERPV